MNWKNDSVKMDSIFKYYPFDHYDSRYGLIKDARYKFTGKERDAETGYDYIEQRYYWNSGSFWPRVDPLVDKYLNLSPYAYCHGNPLKYVDPDGRDDFFNELGEYLEHIDNGTDYVMVRRNNGEVQNLVSFSYSPDNVNNRNMLSNVASYYAQKVGLNQNIDVLDNPKGGESAMFATIARHVSMVVNNGSINSDANTSNNIMNALVHEYDHVKKGTSGAIAEIEAIAKAVTHQTWVNTTESYKQATMQYLVDNANAATRPVFTVIEPIISRLEAFGLILNYNQGANVYSWEILIPEFVITAPRRQ